MSADKRNTGRNEASRWEYVLGAVGALLVTATIVYLAFDAKNDPGTPPDIVVTADTIVRGTHSYVAEITVENRGTETAASVNLRGELRQGDTVIEDAEATLDYLPGHSSRPAGLVFTRDPAQYQLVVRAVGFDVP